MSEFVEAVVVFVTAPGAEAAEKIAHHVLSAKLAACVNILPSIRSLYWWEGKISDDTESMLIMKTQRALVCRLIESVKSVHPYEVPEIIALPVVDGSSTYLRWIAEVTQT